MADQRGPFGRALRITSIQGIAIRVDASWLLIAALVVWSFWARFAAEDDIASGVAIVMAVVGAALFFGSVLAHEVAHALEGKHRGVEIAGITLFLFGGVTESRFDVKRPRDEFALTAVGPFTSFVLAAAFGLVATWAGDFLAVGLVAGTLGWINLALGVFNLLPGAPLDGGRILRSFVWWITGDRYRAIRFAAGTGSVIAGLLIALGVWQLFTPAGFVGGLWFIFIGWFLFQAAQAERSQAQLQQALADVPAGRLVDPSRAAVPADATLSAAVDDWIRAYESDIFPVVDGEQLVGIIGVEQVRGVDRARWPETTVREAMLPVADLPTVDVDAPASDVLDEISRPGETVVATDHDRPVGVVTPRRLVFVARRSLELDGDGSRRGTRRGDRRADRRAERRAERGDRAA